MCLYYVSDDSLDNIHIQDFLRVVKIYFPEDLPWDSHEVFVIQESIFVLLGNDKEETVVVRVIEIMSLTKRPSFTTISSSWNNPCDDSLIAREDAHFL